MIAQDYSSLRFLFMRRIITLKEIIFKPIDPQKMNIPQKFYTIKFIIPNLI